MMRMFYNDDDSTIRAWCTSCGHMISVPCTEAQWEGFRSGRLIQNIFPGETAEVREILGGTGWCDACWSIRLSYLPEDRLKKLSDSLQDMLSGTPFAFGRPLQGQEELIEILEAIESAEDGETAGKVRKAIMDAFEGAKE